MTSDVARGFRKTAGEVYRAEALDGFSWLTHGFGTRHSRHPDNLATLHQIHSDIVVCADGRRGLIGDGDALIADRAGSLVAVKTADCLPILMADVRRRRVAAVHAGWRGTVREIAAKTLAALDANPADVHAALGPAIGPCCFEVGADVAAQFKKWFPERGDLDRRTTLDLAEANRRQLLAASVPAEQLYVAGLCTRCGEEFHSYRRDRRHAGRMFSWIGITASETCGGSAAAPRSSQP